MTLKSSITTNPPSMRRNAPIHPGVTLLEDFMEPLGLSANQLAQMLAVPQNRVSEIVRGRRSISADTALRLERAFGVSAQFWLNLQQQYELILARRNAKGLSRIKPIAA
ncbi:MAG: HigA family addiction module antitoxin [Rhodospirillales bacterium]